MIEPPKFIFFDFKPFRFIAKVFPFWEMQKPVKIEMTGLKCYV